MRKRLSLLQFITAIALANIGVYVGIALVSYNAADPAWNFAAGGDPVNWLGREGALVADILFNFYGLVAYLIAPTLVLWGWRSLRGIAKQSLLRLLAFAAALNVAAAAIALFVGPAPITSQGIVGFVLAQQIQPLLQELPGGILLAAFSGVLFAAVTLSYCWYLRLAHWQQLFRATRQLLRHAYRYSHLLLAWGVWAGKRLSKVSAEPPRIAPVLTARVSEEQLEPKVRSPRARVAPKMTLPDPANGYQLPPLDLLRNVPTTQRVYTAQDPRLLESVEELRQVLKDYSIDGEIIQAHPGPVVVLYEFEPAPGVKSSRVIGLADVLSM